MAKKSLKRNQVVSAENHHNKTDETDGNLEDVHQKSLTCGPVGRNFNVHNIVGLCKQTSSKYYNDKHVSRTGSDLF